jgi:hypothetical protein
MILRHYFYPQKKCFLRPNAFDKLAQLYYIELIAPAKAQLEQLENTIGTPNWRFI